MTAFLLVVFLLHPNGTMSSHAEILTGADLCLSKQEEIVTDMEHLDMDTSHYSVQCIDTGLVRYLDKAS